MIFPKVHISRGSINHDLIFKNKIKYRNQVVLGKACFLAQLALYIDKYFLFYARQLTSLAQSRCNIGYFYHYISTFGPLKKEKEIFYQNVISRSDLIVLLDPVEPSELQRVRVFLKPPGPQE